MRTIEQLRGWASMLIEIQMQRVMMLRTGEEMHRMFARYITERVSFFAL